MATAAKKPAKTSSKAPTAVKPAAKKPVKPVASPAKVAAKKSAATPVTALAAAKKAATAKKAPAAPKRAVAKTTKSAKPPKPPKVNWKPQSFVATHRKDAEFKTGLRAYAAYRDLLTDKATGGAVQSHVIRLIGKCDPKVVSIPHYHGVQFQMLYMLKGWMIGEYEGQGRVKMTAGSCWIQPPGIRHQVIDYSDGCEMIEIILPADFDTVEL
jgi:mannose-6-phosphate isomerase-like protein (cupin superfamily)